MSTRHIERPGQRIAFTPLPGMSAEEVDAEVEKMAAFGDRAIARGDSIWLRWKRIGHRKAGLYAMKNVGPPPWRIPRVIIAVDRRGFMLGAGWRSTAYGVGLIITGVSS